MSDESTVTLIKHGRKGRSGASPRETETHLLTADNLSVYKHDKNVILSLHEYNTAGKPVATYRLLLGEADTVRLRSLIG